jgi:predicted RNA-binding Zn ribbon-like protein
MVPMTDPAPTAPDDLELVRSFVNTIDPDTGTDAIDEPAKLAAFLAAHDLTAPDGRISRVELRRARELREALRALALANNGGPAVPAAIGTLNDAARRSHLVVHFHLADDDSASGPVGVQPERPRAVDVAFARIIGAVQRAMLDGHWSRLKACRLDDCHWAFYDRSKNQSRSWCDMDVCGNRAKARAFRARHRAER